MFCSEYTDLNHNNGPFGGNDFIWKIKDISYVNSYFWHQKYLLPCTKVLDFVACRFISRVLGIGATDSYWVDVKKIKSGKLSAISSDVS